MTRLAAVVLFLGAFAAADTRVRVHVKPEKGARVSEPVTFSVELMTTRWFASGPRLPELDVSGAIVRRLSSFGINGTVEIDGKQYTTQTWEYTIYPQRAGRFEIPALEVRIFPAGEGGAAKPVDATTSSLSFEVDPLPGGVALSAPAFLASQSYEPAEGKGLIVGGSLTRTITLKTEGAPAMLIPPLGASEAEDGMSAYPNAPEVNDKINRGVINGTRVEQVSYLFEKPGKYRFPEIRIPWWNIKTKEIETATLPGLDVEVAPNPELASARDVTVEQGDDAKPGGSAWWIVLVPAALLALFLALRKPVLRFRDRWAASEPAAFAALERAQGSRPTYLALGAWLARAGLEPDADLRCEADALGDHLYGNGGHWDHAALIAAARALRGRARRATRARAAALPPLNPTG